MDRPFLCFLIIHAFDRQTDRQTDKRTPFSSLARAGIPCSAVKIGVASGWVSIRQIFA